MRKKEKPKISILRVALTSFVVDISDVGLNLLVAMLTGSVVVVTQVIAGLADMTASGLTVVGVVRSKKPADKKHPFGYGREVYFWALLAGLFMFMISAVASFWFAWNRFVNPHIVNNLWMAAVVTLVGVVTNGYALTLAVRRLLKHREFSKLAYVFLNSSLIETKTVLVMDLTGTLSSALGLVALWLYSFTGEPRYDALGGMAIASLMAILAFALLLNVRELIIGRSTSGENEERIMKAVLEVAGVIKIVDLRTLIIGSEKLMAHVEVHVEDGLTTDEIERLIDKIQKHVSEKVESVKLVQVEIETPDEEIVTA